MEAVGTLPAFLATALKFNNLVWLPLSLTPLGLLRAASTQRRAPVCACPLYAFLHRSGSGPEGPQLIDDFQMNSHELRCRKVSSMYSNVRKHYFQKYKNGTFGRNFCGKSIGGLSASTRRIEQGCDAGPPVCEGHRRVSRPHGIVSRRFRLPSSRLHIASAWAQTHACRGHESS